MIAKKEWFGRRKYGGWGVSPKSWQGWVYIFVLLIPFILVQSMPFWNNQTRLTFIIIFLLFLFLDIVPIMVGLKRDEREYKIEAISERNAAWFMSLVLVVGIFYEIIISSLKEKLSVNIFLIVALIGGAIIKSISNYALERKRL